MTHTRSRLRDLRDRALFAGLLAALVYIPIPLAANRPLAWLAWMLVVYGLLALWALGELAWPTGNRLPPASRPALVVLLGWLFALLVQCLPLPADLVAVLNPFGYRLERDLALIGVTGASTLSLDAGGSYGEILKYGSYVAAFLLVLATVGSRSRLLVLLAVLILVGVLEALFGIYASVTGYVIFPESGAANELRAGTFVNRNHYANLLTMILGLVLGLLTALINAQPRDSGPGRRRFSDRDSALAVLLLGAAVTLIAGIFMSGSRAPLVFFSLSLAVLLAIAAATGSTRPGERALVPLLLVTVAAVVITLGFDESITRLLNRDWLGGERMLQNRSGFELLSQVWVSGVGAGNYQWVFPMFRGADLRFVTYDHAHNDYLQSAIEQGIPVAALLALAVGLVLRTLFHAYRSRHNPLYRGVVFGCLLSTVFMLLHALVEFNFRIPANAVYFLVIAALGVAAGSLERGQWRSRRPRRDEREELHRS